LQGKPIPRWLCTAILPGIATVFGSKHIAARIVAGAVIARGPAKR
jgi:hypothetical protein